MIGVEESVLLGEILKASNINFGESGVDFEQLLQGNSGLTYEELQFILKDNSITRILSLTLKQELQTSKQYIIINYYNCNKLSSTPLFSRAPRRETVSSSNF